MAVLFSSLRVSLWAAAIFAILPLPGAEAVAGEMREFQSAGGVAMTARLSSHTGDGKTVEIVRQDGQSFTVAVDAFSEEDQAFIRKWMKETVPDVNYSFRYEVSKEKTQGDRINYGYKQVKNQNWAYSVKITNIARHAVGPLKVKYRIFMRNKADGAYSAMNQQGGIQTFDGLAELPGQLDFNKSASFTTKDIQIDQVQYNYYYASSGRFKDSMLGIILRVYDKAGRLIDEHKSGESAMRTLEWKEKKTATE